MTVRIGLCMIVKDEAHVIRRCLDSVRPLVDYVLVEDTGSTDGTQDVIRAWLQEHGIAGEVVEEAWRDFALNRTHALSCLRRHADIDYALIIDADDTLEYEPGFDPAAFKASMSADLYDLVIRYGNIRYSRPQMVRNARQFSYRGVLHEFIEVPPDAQGRATAEGFAMRINGGGARSQDPEKFVRDARILAQALAEESDPFLRSRYTFYLAQSYLDCGEREKALEHYLARGQMGFWQEEVFVALYRAAQLKEALGHPEEEVIAAYLRASEAQPARAEALHGASRFCRNKGRHKEGAEIARPGIDLPMPGSGLFIEPWIYQWGLLDEFAVNAYWSGDHQGCLDACLRMLAIETLDEATKRRAAENARFASEKLGNSANDFVSSINPPPIKTKKHADDTSIVQDGASKSEYINIFRVCPPGYLHAGAYQDLITVVECGLRRAGHKVQIVDDLHSLSERAIIIGAHLASSSLLAEIPENAVIYNTEHVNSPFMVENYISCLRRHPVWDYSQDNASALSEMFAKPVDYVPCGFVPELCGELSAGHEDIDVLFYGSMNDRRQKIIEGLRAAGLRVEVAFGVYAKARDSLIGRAKVILNMHFYEPGHFEILRVGYLLANRKAVVSEVNQGESVDADLVGGFAAVPYSDLIKQCAQLVQDEVRRKGLAEAGFEIFSARHASEILQRAVTKTWVNGINNSTSAPRRLVIGSGKSWDSAALNLDISSDWNPDILVDISDGRIFDVTHSCKRFGPLKLEKGYFERIDAHHVLEHIPNLVLAMKNSLDLLSYGGEMWITVPYDLSYGAWQDPTHVRAFNERSWLYYSDWFWYLGWGDARFDVVDQKFIYSPFGVYLSERGMNHEEILRSNRAVDEMRVVLRKRALTADERGYALKMRGGERKAH
jgi:tetratricopeptide (TPR) repeat protein